MEPHQIISLMDYFGADNTFAMGDHDDHVHVGYQPLYGPGARQRLEAVQPDPEAGPVGAPDRPPRRDRQPDGPDLALRRRAPERTKGKQTRERASSAHLGE